MLIKRNNDVKVVGQFITNFSQLSCTSDLVHNKIPKNNVSSDGEVDDNKTHEKKEILRIRKAWKEMKEIEKGKKLDKCPVTENITSNNSDVPIIYPCDKITTTSQLRCKEEPRLFKLSVETKTTKHPSRNIKKAARGDIKGITHPNKKRFHLGYRGKKGDFSVPVVNKNYPASLEDFSPSENVSVISNNANWTHKTKSDGHTESYDPILGIFNAVASKLDLPHENMNEIHPEVFNPSPNTIAISNKLNLSHKTTTGYLDDHDPWTERKYFQNETMNSAVKMMPITSYGNIPYIEIEIPIEGICNYSQNPKSSKETVSVKPLPNDKPIPFELKSQIQKMDTLSSSVNDSTFDSDQSFRSHVTYEEESLLECSTITPSSTCDSEDPPPLLPQPRMSPYPQQMIAGRANQIIPTPVAFPFNPLPTLALLTMYHTPYIMPQMGLLRCNNLRNINEWMSHGWPGISQINPIGFGSSNYFYGRRDPFMNNELGYENGSANLLENELLNNSENSGPSWRSTSKTKSRDSSNYQMKIVNQLNDDLKERLEKSTKKKDFKKSDEEIDSDIEEMKIEIGLLEDKYTKSRANKTTRK